jgi:DNA transformation protein
VGRKDASFKEFVLDQLASLGPVDARAMFGGYGLYHLGIFFGIIHKGRLFFKTNKNTRKAYLSVGMEPFKPNDKQTLKNYYEVPSDVLDDHERLSAFAEKAVKCGDGAG